MGKLFHGGESVIDQWLWAWGPCSYMFPMQMRVESSFIHVTNADGGGTPIDTCHLC